MLKIQFKLIDILKECSTLDKTQSLMRNARKAKKKQFESEKKLSRKQKNGLITV
jgi:uncharacterized protein YaiL (DUF2058 family)